MDKQITVFLLLLLFTTAHSLSCYLCDGLLGSCVNQTVTTCASGTAMCESTTMATQFGGIGTIEKLKGCAADCGNGSINFSIVMLSYECCNSDLCNVQDAPDPSTDAPNGNTCYTCDESNNCSIVLNCSGSEDLCVTATAGTLLRPAMTLKGCVSKSICDAVTSISGAQNISCCSGNLCNGAKSVTQSFLFLCFPLIAFILMP